MLNTPNIYYSVKTVVIGYSLLYLKYWNILLFYCKTILE